MKDYCNCSIKPSTNRNYQGEWLCNNCGKSINQPKQKMKTKEYVGLTFNNKAIEVLMMIPPYSKNYAQAISAIIKTKDL